MKLTSKKGFTLVELIIVIAILGIIALIAVPSLTNVQANSRVNADYNSAYKIGETIRIWLTDCDRDEYTKRTGRIKDQWVLLSNIKQGLGNYMSDAKDKPQGLTGSEYYVTWMSKSGKIAIAVSADNNITPTQSYGIDTNNVIQEGIIYLEGYGEIARATPITLPTTLATGAKDPGDPE